MRKSCWICMLLLSLMFLPVMLHAQTQPVGVPAPSLQAAGAAVPTATAAPNPKTSEEFFARARQLSDLEASGIPFHLKATFVASGDAEFTGNGTYEEWWQSKDVWRKEATLGKYKYVAVKNGTKTAASATSDYMPLRIRQIQGLQIFRFISPTETHSNWEVVSPVTGTSSGEMVRENEPCGPEFQGARCVLQYEFSADGVLRSYRYNDMAETYSDFRPFGNLLFPRKIVSVLRAKPINTATVVLLERLAENDRKLFDAEAIPELGTVPPEPIAVAPPKGTKPPKMIYSAQLNYKKSKQQFHPAGVVIVECTVDTNGEVREPFVQLSDGRTFDDAALESVRSATFKPGRRNGRRVLVEMALVILFHGPT